MRKKETQSVHIMGSCVCKESPIFYASSRDGTTLAFIHSQVSDYLKNEIPIFTLFFNKFLSP